MDNNNSVKQIDVTAIIKAMIKNRKAYFIGLPVSFILSVLIIMCVPRHYKSTAKLAPELSSFSTGSLGNLPLLLVSTSVLLLLTKMPFSLNCIQT